MSSLKYIPAGFFKERTMVLPENAIKRLAYLLPVLLLIIISASLYYQCIQYDLTYFDDDVLIVKNYAFISDYKNIPNFFISPTVSSFYRPVLTLSFSIETLIFKNLTIQHFSNVLLHIAAVLSVFVFLKKLKFDKTLVFLFTALFAVHPAFTQAVVWIPGRNDLLLAIFAILSLIFLSDYFNCDKNRRIKYFLFSASFFLALFTKETAIVLAAVIPAFMFLFCKKARKKDYLTVFIPIILTAALFFILRAVSLKYADLPSAAEMIGTLIKDSHVILNYIEYSVIPSRIRLIGYDLPLDFLTFFALAVFLVPLSASLLFNIGRRSVIFFGIFWFIIFLLPTFAMPNYFLSQRIYLSCIGAMIMFLEFCSDLSVKFPVYKKYIVLLLTAFIALFAFASSAQTKKFLDREVFLYNAATEEPKAPLIKMKISEYYIEKGMLEEAKAELNKIEPNAQGGFTLRFYETLGYIYFLEKNYPAAQDIFEQILKLNPNNENSLAYMAEILLINEKYDDALVFAQKVSRLYPSNISRKIRCEEIGRTVSAHKNPETLK
jgi:tetratricopeptide (TPR) repeat protein